MHRAFTWGSHGNFVFFALSFRLDLFDPKARNRPDYVKMKTSSFNWAGRNSGTVLRILRLRIGQKRTEDEMPKSEVASVRTLRPSFPLTKGGVKEKVFK